MCLVVAQEAHMCLVVAQEAHMCLVPLQAKNISITVKTMAVGISYLATFIFAANSAGLLGEARGAARGACHCHTTATPLPHYCHTTASAAAAELA